MNGASCTKMRPQQKEKNIFTQQKKDLETIKTN